MASRLSARDLAGPIAIFFGALLLVAAIALPLFYVDSLKKTPMDLDITTVSESQVQEGVSDNDELPAKLLNRCSLKGSEAQVSDAELTGQQRVIVTDPADSTRATLQAGSSDRIDSYMNGNQPYTPSADDDCMSSIFTATVDKVTINRESAEPAIGDGGQSELQLAAGSDALPLPDRAGLQYRFPFGVEKTDNYQYYDLPTRTTNPLKFVGEEEVAGVSTYHFTQEIPEFDLSQLPDANGVQLSGTSINQTAGWFGGFEGVDDAERMTASLNQKTTRDLFVEPASGTIVDDREHIQQYFKIDAGVDAPQAVTDYRLTALDVVMSYDKDTLEATADRAGDISGPINLWGKWFPIIGGILGVVLLAGGIWLLLRGGRKAAAE